MTPEPRTLPALIRSESRRYLAAVLAEGLSTLFLFATPWLTMVALDRLAEDAADGAPAPAARSTGPRFLEDLLRGADLEETLWRVAAAVLACSALSGVLLFARTWWSAAASERIVRGLRERLFAHVQRLPMPWHDAAETGDVVQRCSSDVETVRLFLSSQIVEIGRAVILLALVIPALLALDVRMTLVTLALFPPIVVFALVFFRRVRRRFQEMDEAEGVLTSVLQENLTGIRVVRAFARQRHECDKFARANGDYRDKNRRFVESLATFWSLSDLMCFTQIGLVVLVGGARMQAGTLGVGTFFAIFSYVFVVIWPVRHFGRVLADAGKATVSMDRIREVLDAEAEPRVEITSAPTAGRVEFEHVSFSYAGGGEVLRDVSFTLEPGRSLALIGPPGAGKSTLVRLLTRLYEGYEGSIRVDGHELRDLPHAAVRGAVASVLQQPFVFARTVESNLGLGAPDSTREQLEEAARDADLHESILGFDGGYDAVLGERGVTLSGGQRQRLAIARALAKEAPILVLDDSLSAVDAETEERILGALTSDRNQRTRILIAHRISTLRGADEILVLDRGRVVERGDHESLLAAGGAYARLVRMQGLEHGEPAAVEASARRSS